MTAKMARRKRHARHKQRETRRREDSLFFGRGEFPASATSMTICSCGARAFSRGDGPGSYDFMDDFDAAHAYCDDWDAAGLRLSISPDRIRNANRRAS